MLQSNVLLSEMIAGKPVPIDDSVMWALLGGEVYPLFNADDILESMAQLDEFCAAQYVVIAALL